MKRTCAVLLPAFVLAATTIPNFSRAQNDGYAVTARGANYSILQKTTVENGTNRVHQYTELATGLNYTNSYGQLVESEEQIDILPNGGAAAVQGQHQVYFPADIADGVLEVVTPDGRHLQSRPLGVSYDDGSNTVFIATLTNAVGWLTASNQITYRNCFSGIDADLVCTYRRSGFECDLVFRRQPPTPDQYGLDDSSSTLQLVTEFFNTQDPQEIPAAYDEWYGLQDDTLKFGKLTMKQGKAFAVGGSGSNSAQNSRSRFTSAATSSVYKRWLHIQGRTFLIEEVPLEYLADDLNTLPPETNALTSKVTGRLRMASNHLKMPPAQEFVSDASKIQIAANGLKRQPGVVLDYDEIDNIFTNDFTFQNGTTYYISSVFFSSGTTTFEGGTVVKIADEATLYCDDVVSEATSDHPAIFTGPDDDSVGDTIDGSSGIPYQGDAGILQANGNCPRNARFFYCLIGLYLYGDTDVWDCQFVNCAFAIDDSTVDSYDGTGTVTLHNVLFAGCQDDVGQDGGVPVNIQGEQVTCDGGIIGWYGELETGGLTNSLLTGVSGGTNGMAFQNCVLLNSNAGIYQTAGGAGYYLATSSPYRNVGTTNINPDLLAELQTMTTYAPQDGGWPDTNAPDLGYHYPVNEDSDHDGLPDWWEWKYYGNYNQNGTNSDGNGNTLLYDYQNSLAPYNQDLDHDGLADGWENHWYGNLNQTSTNLDGGGVNTLGYDYSNNITPIVYQFTGLQVSNNHVNSGTPTVHLDVTGSPYYVAVLVDNTNFAPTTWSAYTTASITANLGTNEGWHDIWIGLRGYADGTNAAVWQWTRLKLDLTPPLLVVTNPTNATVDVPVIQLQGYSSEALSRISYDLTNALGLVTNQQVVVEDENYSTNTWEFTTNYFQAYDLPLTNGVNQITLHATDLAGNVATLTTNITLSYAGKTNPPAITLLWPVDGLEICGSNIVCRGQVADPTASVTVQLVDANGQTNTADSLVGRDGIFYADNLTLATGTNHLSYTIQDAAGNTITTNLTVATSDLGLTIDPVVAGQSLVTGRIDDDSYTVYVNGVTATNNGDGTWSATITPIGVGGGAVVVNAVNGGDPSTQQIVQPPQGVFTSAYQEHYDDLSSFVEDWLGIDFYDTGTMSWEDGKGGTEYDHVGYSEIVDFHDTWPVSRWPQPLPAGTGIEDDIPYSSGTPDEETNSNLLLSLPLEHRDTSEHYVTDNGKNGVWHVTDDAEVKLATGGPVGSTQKNLWCISASATGYTNDASGNPVGYAIPPEQISIGKLGNLDTNGNLWVMLPDNDPDIITPTVKGKDIYSFSKPTPGKYTLIHTTECTAAGDTNNARKTIGIGELVGFGGMPGNTMWKVSGNGTISGTNGSGTIFTANHSHGAATVTAQVESASLSVAFSVIAPTGISASVNTNVGLGTVGTNSIGADTQFNAQLQPTTVSFGNNTFRENISALTITWPNGTNQQMSYTYQKGLPPGGCDVEYIDDIGDGPDSISKLYNGTNYVSFSYTLNWTDQYKDDSGTNWVNFANMQTTTQYRSDGSCQETYQGVSGSWQGPWQ